MTIVLTPTAASATTRDFTSVDAYLESTELHLYTGEGAINRTETIPLSPPQTDVRNNPNEMPSALGRFFAQSDFSHGSLQHYFHIESSDVAKYLHSEGFDISTPGLLKHLPAVLTNAASLTGGSGRQAQAGGSLYVCHGNVLKKFASPSAAPTSVDPHAGEGAVAAQDITAEGDRKFVALGANGIHLLDGADSATHYNDAQAIRVAMLKDRLIACSATALYEITASGAAPGAKTTLKTGWTFTDLGENGQYVYATAIHETSGLSKIFHYGLDSTGAFVEMGSTWMPNNELAYSFKGYLGIVLIGGGRVNASGGKDTILYKAVPDSDGFLPLQLIADATGAGARDLACRSIATKGRNFLVGWTLGATSTYGVREGLALYDPALDSFSHHLASSTVTSTPDPVLSCSVFAGRVVFVTTDGLYYEDTATKVATATLISSIANWNNPGLKNWDQSEIATKALPNTASVAVSYSTQHPEANSWTSAGSHTVPDATKATFRHANVESARFAIKLVSSATSSAATAPEIETFSVRSNPTVSDIEYRLTRTIDLTATFNVGGRGATRHYNPRTRRDTLRGQMFDWFNWYEADESYNLRLVQMSEIKQAGYRSSQGDGRDERFIVQVVMEGRAT